MLRDNGFGVVGRADQTVVWFARFAPGGFRYDRENPPRPWLVRVPPDTRYRGRCDRSADAIRPRRSGPRVDQTSMCCRMVLSVVWSSCRPFAIYDVIEPYDAVT